jgi:hypothetical protein
MIMDRCEKNVKGAEKRPSVGFEKETRSAVTVADTLAKEMPRRIRKNQSLA